MSRAARAKIDNAVQQKNPVPLFRMVSAETIQKLARELLGLHRPIAFNWAGKFGLGAPHGTSPDSAMNSGYSCEYCKAQLSFAIVAYCRTNRDRFGGRILCTTCQGKFGPT